MNKIEDAIYNIHKIDNNTNKSKYINKIHPLSKLIITILYILLLTSINKYNLNQILLMGIYLIIYSIVFDLSVIDYLKRLKGILILLVLVGIANPILDKNIIFTINNISITTGMISMITLILKGLFCIIASCILIETTSIEKICYALKLLHIPNILITIIMLIYRYIIIFLKEAQRIWISYKMRAPNQKGINIKVWGSMIGSMMLRSIDKANVVYQSMELRGFNPDTFFIKEQVLDIKSIIFLIVNIFIIIGFRFIPIFR